MSSTAVAAARVPSATKSSSSSPTVVLAKGDSSGVTEKKLTNSAATKTTHASTASATTKKDAKPSATEPDPLPADLRRILTEVARTGKCTWLSWNGKDAPEAPMPPDAVTTPNKAPGSVSSVGSHSASRFTPSSSAFSSFSGKAPVRKKLRNGIVRRRFTTENGTSAPTTATTTTTTTTTTTASAARKRPLYRTPSASGSTFSASSIGSAGSEPEDSTQYECDSEGTSATTNSEFSVELHPQQRAAARRRVVIQPMASRLLSPKKYKTLQEAMRAALGLVLDHSYRYRGGYKLSPAELRIHAAAVAAQQVKQQPSPEKTFQQRRRRLLAMLCGDEKSSDETKLTVPSHLGGKDNVVDGPPFTIQRIAEVLVTPDRYYKQTHKLCNCLEKLLLVTSPASAFGDAGLGGETAESKSEETDSNVLVDKRGRQDSEFKSRRLKRRMSSLSDDENTQKTSPQHAQPSNSKQGPAEENVARKQASPERSTAKEEGDETGKTQQEASEDNPTNDSDENSREIIEAAARASLRTKFDHVGIDPHSPGAVNRNVVDIAGNRGMTSSPPPPTLSAAPGITMPGGFGRHMGEAASPDASADSLHAGITRAPIPVMFSATNEGGTPVQALHANHSMHLLQMHHAAALTGVPLGGSPLDLVIDPTTASAPSPSAAPAPAPTDVADLEAEPGRSDASNSDVDSESDDLSLDDSASDRSDGSDSGHYEPFTAARVMALNRLQQQRMQNRASMLPNAAGSHFQGDGFRPPADSEYQSGDSIDSTLAEDSCGSDSSSSDMAD